LYDEADDECENTENYDDECDINIGSDDEDYNNNDSDNLDDEDETEIDQSNMNIENTNTTDSKNESSNSSLERGKSKCKKAKLETVTWSKEARDIITPLSRSKHFTGRIADGVPSTPLDILRLFITEKLITDIVTFTNKYMNKKQNNVPHTNENELLAFIGLHIFMGIVVLPRTRMYWSTDFGQPFVQNTMSRDRFNQLLQNVVVNNPTNDDAISDPATHTAYFIKHLNKIFPKYYKPSQYLTLDELMVAFKGASDIKQYVPSKPHPHGYKIFGLASDNYLRKIELYLGRSQKKSVKGPIHELVLRMTEGYEDENYILFTDSLFTSPAVMVDLAERKIAMCGSVSLKRVGMPNEDLISQETLRNMHVHQSLHYHSSNMHLVLWKDRSIVKLLYNHIITPTNTQNIKRWGDEHEKKIVTCPQALYDYFHYAKSIDIVGQLHYNYPIGRKAMRQYPSLIWWLIDICIVNAYTLWTMKQNNKNHLTFRMQLMNELVRDYRMSRMSSSQNTTITNTTMNEFDHYPKRADAKNDCVACSSRPSNRRRSAYICSACNVHLCIDSCFRSYHLTMNTRT
jgi:hypothetical protein